MLVTRKEDKKRQERKYGDERMEKEGEGDKRLSAAEVALKALEGSVKEKDADEIKPSVDEI
jgi:hypothetical protein